MHIMGEIPDEYKAREEERRQREGERKGKGGEGKGLIITSKNRSRRRRPSCPRERFASVWGPWCQRSS